MNKKLYFNILLGILSCVSLLACSDDNSIGNSPPLYSTGFLWDGGGISKVGLYCIEKDSLHRFHFSDEVGYVAKTKTIGDYSDMLLYISIHSCYYSDRLLSRYGITNKAEREKISKLEKEYYKTKSALLVEDLDSFANHSRETVGSLWPAFFTAYVNGEVTITCDKPLYGELPGTNLGKYFDVISLGGCLPVGKESTKLLYHFGQKLPTDMEELFPQEAWLVPYYELHFKELPSEKYDNLTLHLSFPMTIEHSLDYVVSQYNGRGFSRYTETVFEADCPINFNWD